MNQHQLTTWKHSLRSLPSRRDVLRGLASAGLGLGGLRLSDVVAARNTKKGKKRKKKRSSANCRPNCADRVCGNDGCGGYCGTCEANQVCNGGSCCVPESRSATCAGRCGTWTNNCGQQVACATCPAGQKCLSNGSCAVVCAANEACPATGGTCGCSNPSVEGERHCISGFLQPDITCASTEDCPPGSHCQDIGAADPICIPVCR